MSRLIKILKYSDSRIVFDKGSFDEWCVYIEDSSGSKYAPLDVEYFSELQKISKKYGSSKVYNDFVKIYELTSSEIDNRVLSLIDKIVNTYDIEDRPAIEKWFTVIYAGMIAEENKQGAILKKRIKRLGMYQVLLEGIDPKKAANFSKGKRWTELDILMRQKGF